MIVKVGVVALKVETSSQRRAMRKWFCNLSAKPGNNDQLDSTGNDRESERTAGEGRKDKEEEKECPAEKLRRTLDPSELFSNGRDRRRHHHVHHDRHRSRA